MNPNFSECIIIPLAIYKQHCIKDSDSDFDLLYDPRIPSAEKIKWYAQNVKLRPPQSEYPKVEIANPAESKVSGLQQDIDSILQNIMIKNRPFANSILTRILQHPDLIRWNEKFEVSINRNTVPDSNISDLLKYVSGEKIITSTGLDVPQVGREFYNILSEIDIPSSWLKIRPRQATAQSWISL